MKIKNKFKLDFLNFISIFFTDCTNKIIKDYLLSIINFIEKMESSLDENQIALLYLKKIIINELDLLLSLRNNSNLNSYNFLISKKKNIISISIKNNFIKDLNEEDLYFFLNDIFSLFYNKNYLIKLDDKYINYTSNQDISYIKVSIKDILSKNEYGKDSLKISFLIKEGFSKNKDYSIEDLDTNYGDRIKILRIKNIIIEEDFYFIDLRDFIFFQEKIIKLLITNKNFIEEKFNFNKIKQDIIESRKYLNESDFNDYLRSYLLENKKNNHFFQSYFNRIWENWSIKSKFILDRKSLLNSEKKMIFLIESNIENNCFKAKIYFKKMDIYINRIDGSHSFSEIYRNIKKIIEINLKVYNLSITELKIDKIFYLNKEHKIDSKYHTKIDLIEELVGIEENNIRISVFFIIKHIHKND